MQLEEFLERSAERLPQKVALVCGSERLTYAEIEERCNILAHGLMDEGVERGDRVIIHLGNSVETVLGIFATLKAGGVFVVINPTTKRDKLIHILNDCQAKALITDQRGYSWIKGDLNRLPSLRVVLVKGIGGIEGDGQRRVLPLEALLNSSTLSRRRPEKRCIDIDLAALVYTSGSTGIPKGVMLTHLNMVSAATSITTYLENTEEDVVINVLPLSFDYGLYQIIMAFKVGARVILERSFTYPHTVMERIEAEGVTGFPIVPTISAILLQLNLDRYDLSSLRYITNTGAALPVGHIRRLRRLLPHVRIYSMYGLTECKRVAYLPPEEIDRRPDSVGKAMPNVEVYIVDDRGNRVGPGVVGELVVRGSNVMKGYWGMPEETDRVLRPGPLPGEKVLYTGDLFRMDEDGYLYFIGRRDDIIKTRGEKVSPKEIENVLYSMDGVAEVAVYGVPDGILGQAVKAVVVPEKGANLTEQAIRRYCIEHLEDFMVPKYIEIRGSLPKTESGKINKRELEAV